MNFPKRLELLLWAVLALPKACGDGGGEREAASDSGPVQGAPMLSDPPPDHCRELGGSGSSGQMGPPVGLAGHPQKTGKTGSCRGSMSADSSTGMDHLLEHSILQAGSPPTSPLQPLQGEGGLGFF